MKLEEHFEKWKRKSVPELRKKKTKKNATFSSQNLFNKSSIIGKREKEEKKGQSERVEKKTREQLIKKRE